MAILKGSTAKCLKHFAAAEFGGGDKYAHLQSFTGVSTVRTCHRWIDGSLPVGQTLLRMRYYFEFLGYRVDELEKLKLPVRTFGRILAFGAAPLEEAFKAVGLLENKSGGSQLMDILQGRQGVSVSRQAKMHEFNAKYEALLKRKQQQTPRLVLIVEDAKEQPQRSRQGSSSLAKETQPVLADERVVEALAGLYRAIVPLARTLVAAAPEQRDRMRKLAGHGVVFEASNLTSRLCSETSLKLNSARK